MITIGQRTTRIVVTITTQIKPITNSSRKYAGLAHLKNKEE